MTETKLLIATTNKGKLKEIKHFLSDSSFVILSLSDLDVNLPEPEETEATLEGNAMLKAKYYAEKTQYLTLADDSGLFIKALDGWPGIKSARIADPDKGQVDSVLGQLKDVPASDRSACFKSAIAVYNPSTKNMFISLGETDGMISEEALVEKDCLSYGYNPIFFVLDAKKTYAQMRLPEKNAHSHRGKALVKAKYYLANQFNTKQFVAPLGIIIKDGNILINKRNDPHNPEFHGKWEFPGGGIEFGETIEENLKREVKEETGYDVMPVQRINYVGLDQREGKYSKYQVFLLPHICKIIGGKAFLNETEVLDSKWVTPSEIFDFKLVGDNRQLYTEILPEIKQYISNHT
jgi:XTP/dITP diphosphohydrolase